MVAWINLCRSGYRRLRSVIGNCAGSEPAKSFTTNTHPEHNSLQNAFVLRPCKVQTRVIRPRPEP
jgi:hypothetical protein